MPTSYIKKLADEGKGSVAALEKKWDEAKAKAHEEGKGDNYAYITSIFKNMVGASAEPMLQAAARILASSELTAHNALAFLISLGLTFQGTPKIQETAHDKTRFFSFEISEEDYKKAEAHLVQHFGRPHEKQQWQIGHDREVGLLAFKEDGTRSIYLKETE